MTLPTEDSFSDPDKISEAIKKFKLGFTADEANEAFKIVSTDSINSPDNPWNRRV